MTCLRKLLSSGSLSFWAAWVMVILLATALRLPFPNWDAGIAAHPDERYVLDVAHKVTLWGNPCEAAPDFPYGHLPVYIARLLITAAPGADPLYAARLLMGLVSVLLVALAGAWGANLSPRPPPLRLCQTFGEGEMCVRRRSPDRGAGLVAALVLALAPFPIQHARFYTVDLWGAVFASASVLMIMRRRRALASVLLGLALACKASLIWCAVPLAYTLLAAPGLGGSRHVRSESDDPNPNRKLRCVWHAIRVWRTVRRRARALGLYVGIALLTFFVVSPWSFLRPIACWQGLLIQASLVSGRFVFPYTRQYAGTWPYLYPLTQMALWGLGPLATLLGLWGVGRALWRWGRARAADGGARSARWSPTYVAVVWTLAYGLVMGGLYVKFPRYLLPLYPTWVGWAVVSVMPFVRDNCIMGPSSRRPPELSRSLTLGWMVLVLLTLPLGIAQATVYVQPHPWVGASRWLYENLRPEATVAVEQWDHPLPVPLPEGDPDRYTQVSLPVFAAADSAEVAALARLDAALREADVIILASRRGYGAVTRQPWPQVQAWYRRLILEREALVFARCPRLGPIALTDDPLADAGLPVPTSLPARCGVPYALRLPRLDESFRVYDSPTVWVFVRLP